jgi:hypothetical protein
LSYFLAALEVLEETRADDLRRAALAVRIGQHANDKEWQRFMEG